jgi:hypothetical protein
MADIHILADNGEAAAYPEEHIPTLLQSGEISSESLYWREGMADWEPLSTYRTPARTSFRRTEPVSLPIMPERPVQSPGGTPPSNHQAPATAKPATARIAPVPRAVQPGLTSAPPRSPEGLARSRYRFRRNPWPLTVILELWLAGCLVIALVELTQAIVDYHRVNALTPAAVSQDQAVAATAAPPAPETAPAPVAPSAPPIQVGTLDTAASPSLEGIPAPPQKFNFTQADLLKWSGWAANLLLLLPYFMWLYRTGLNTRYLSPMMRLNPAFSVGCYFIPFINLFRPLQDMQEIWRVSGNPRSWMSDRGSIFVGIWWVLTLATIGMSLESSALFATATSQDETRFAAWFFIIQKCVQAAWYVVFIALVGLVMGRQVSSIKRARSSSRTRRLV